MFYSNEILNSTQYGVSTIWRVATVGKGSQQRLNKKVIQEVNVPKACEKILDPGAPLALRLQGSLLYGVSRVFAHQCNYVLNDAEKTQSDMLTFFRVMQTNSIDPQAGKTKRHRITLEDDPSFDPFSVLPNLDLLNSVESLAFFQSQASSNKVSQMTPLSGPSQGSSGSGRAASLLGFDLPPSELSAGSRLILSDLAGHSSPLAKQLAQTNTADFKPFEIDELDNLPGLELDFDADGNLIGLVNPEELQLPELPKLNKDQVQQLHTKAGVLTQDAQDIFNLATDDGLVIMGEEALPDAEAFPPLAAAAGANTASTQNAETADGVQQATAPSRRSRARKVPVLIDNKDLRVSRVEFRRWDEKYVANMKALQKHTTQTSAAQAKKNAASLVFGNGLAMVGAVQGIFHVQHPLASHFAGMPLIANLQGRPLEDLLPTEKRGRRRSSSEAFEDEEEEKGRERHVRQRREEDLEQGRGAHPDDNAQLLFGDDSLPEMGMEGVAAMDDQHSSMMPWSRAPSLAPGSSVRGQESARKAIQDPSPLFNREAAIRHLERHSIQGAPAFSSDDFAPLHPYDAPGEYSESIQGPEFNLDHEGKPTASQLDLASREFIEYARDQAAAQGEMRASQTGNRLWIDFEKLANPEAHSRSIATEAFMHVLSLATKNTIAVKQDGIRNNVPFGTIHIGLPMPDEGEEGK